MSGLKVDPGHQRRNPPGYFGVIYEIPILIDCRFAYGGCGYDRHTSFDYYHLNSVEKDELGNYLISGRNLHTLSYIDGKTGEVLWNLGGIYNDFEDLSGGAATNFSWQHDARWHYSSSSISLFDNSNHEYADPDVQSRGIVMVLDVDAKTTSLRREYFHPQGMRSFSQGDTQLFEDTGNVFVGWGRNPAFTEFSPEGEVLCDARFGATAFFNFGAITSYRIFRGDWDGRPSFPPSAVIEGLSMYVSWNGDTEVDRWQVEAAKTEDGDYEVLSQVFRTGFETRIPLQPNDRYTAYRASGLHRNGTVLGISKPLVGKVSRPLLSPLVISIIGLLVCSLGLVLAIYASAVACIRWQHGRTRRDGYTYKPMAAGWDEGESLQLEDASLSPRICGPL